MTTKPALTIWLSRFQKLPLYVCYRCSTIAEKIHRRSCKSALWNSPTNTSVLTQLKELVAFHLLSGRLGKACVGFYMVGLVIARAKGGLKLFSQLASQLLLLSQAKQGDGATQVNRV